MHSAINDFDWPASYWVYGAGYAVTFDVVILHFFSPARNKRSSALNSSSQEPET